MKSFLKIFFFAAALFFIFISTASAESTETAANQDFLIIGWVSSVRNEYLQIKLNNIIIPNVEKVAGSDEKHITNLKSNKIKVSDFKYTDSARSPAVGDYLVLSLRPADKGFYKIKDYAYRVNSLKPDSLKIIIPDEVINDKEVKPAVYAEYYKQNLFINSAGNSRYSFSYSQPLQILSIRYDDKLLREVNFVEMKKFFSDLNTDYGFELEISDENIIAVQGTGVKILSFLYQMLIIFAILIIIIAAILSIVRYKYSKNKECRDYYE